MSGDFHLFLRLMIWCDCEFFRSAFVVLEAICPLTSVDGIRYAPIFEADGKKALRGRVHCEIISVKYSAILTNGSLLFCLLDV